MGRIHSGRNFNAKQGFQLTMAMTMTAVRCPYCISGDEFTPMVAVADGRYMCGKCGHLAIPKDETFRCACRKCFELRALDARRCG